MSRVLEQACLFLLWDGSAVITASTPPATLAPDRE